MFSRLKKYLSKDKGSAAIILSLMVSAGVLSTIYFTQKMTSSFLSGLSQSMEEWEKHLVTESAQTLAAYLVSNNLVMCREKGWTGKDANCKWSTAAGTDNPSQFHLSDELDSADGLSYKGAYTVDDSNREYKMTFQLVDWRSTSIESLIGDIPEAICRDKNTLKIIREATCVNYKDSSNPIEQACQVNGSEDPDTLCEYIKQVDGDYWIVLIKVEVDYEDPVSKADLKHIALSGIRRPLSSIKFKDIFAGVTCSMGCTGGNTVNPFTSCRSHVIPAKAGHYTGKASNVVAIENEGPGAVYSLSLMKTAVQYMKPENTVTLDVTPDIIKEAGKEVLLPGEVIRFEYFYDCPIKVVKRRVYKTGNQARVETKTNTREVLFEHYLYSLNFNSEDPIGVCYAASGGTPPPETDPDLNLDFVLAINNDQRLASAFCNLSNPNCSDNNGKTGSCRFVGLEPQRIFSIPNPAVSNHNSILKEVVTTITTPPPPPAVQRISTDGGCDGASGRDGAT